MRRFHDRIDRTGFLISYLNTIFLHLEPLSRLGLTQLPGNAQSKGLP